MVSEGEIYDMHKKSVCIISLNVNVNVKICRQKFPNFLWGSGTKGKDRPLLLLALAPDNRRHGKTAHTPFTCYLTVTLLLYRILSTKST